MVATDSQHAATRAIFGEHEKAVSGARPELAKAPLSLKLSSPTMPPPAVTVAVDTPSCSPAATPPAGPGQPYGPEVHDEEHLVGAVGSGAMRGPTGSGAMRHYAPASKRHKKDRHIKNLKGGMPPLDINIKLDVIDEAELSEDSPRAGEGYDSDEETASDSSPARRNSDEVDRCVPARTHYYSSFPARPPPRLTFVCPSAGHANASAGVSTAPRRLRTCHCPA